MSASPSILSISPTVNHHPMKDRLIEECEEGMAGAVARRFLGRWVLRQELCKYQHGNPPKSDTYTISAEGSELSFSIDGVMHNNAPFKFQYKGVPDGREHPFPVAQLADTLITKVSGDSLYTISRKGKVVSTAERRLSPDGKTLTVTQSGLTIDGKEFSNISVYEKHTTD